MISYSALASSFDWHSSRYWLTQFEILALETPNFAARALIVWPYSR